MWRNKFKSRVFGWVRCPDRPFFKRGCHGCPVFLHGRKRQFPEYHDTMTPKHPFLKDYFKPGGGYTA